MIVRKHTLIYFWAEYYYFIWMQQIKFRAFGIKDIPPLLGILQLNTPRYFHPAEKPEFEKYLEKYADNYFVVEKAGQVIGAGGINYSGPGTAARISWDMVHPGFQGQGIGKMLTHYRLGKIREREGIKTVTVRTTQMAHLFYHKMGFVLEKTAKDFWAPGFDLYQMKMRLRQ